MVEALMVVALMVVAPRGPTRSAGASSRPDPEMCMARYCYDHLAGQLGTRMTEALVSRGVLRADGKAFAVSEAGQAWLRGFGVDLVALSYGRRKLAYRCLDWTERKDHLAGALGAALAARMLELGWLTRRKGSRLLTVTPGGKRGLQAELGLTL
jgi:hypothetical protein